MAKTKQEPLDQVFMALADGTRRKMVHMLAESELSVSELSEPFDMSLAAVSKHIKVLENARLIKRRIEGRSHIFQLVPEQLTGALDWISIYRYFWSKRMDNLEQLFNESEQVNEGKKSED
ncbi:ArsR/SmtB family transcription factor [Aliikangiella coralliicola]|uniref:ArsR/SmtB family transcription factor n=1 Tax=Aliikangiella coralliicola TaxID=2592383 RepID=UPI001FE5F3DD|nr:metalloregulator ArsR/SmtB family transcription factor [Aliikangiella coralliicola]